MPAPDRAHGTEIRVGATGNGNSTSWTTLGLVGDISGPEETNDPVEVTTHDSSGTVQRIAGLHDPGTASFDVMYESTNTLHRSTSGLLNDLQNAINRDIRLVMPSTVGGESVADFPAIVTSVGNEFPVDGGAITRSFEVQATSTVTWSTST